MHIFDATAYLQVGPKYFQYEILPYFTHRYAEVVELEDSFLVAKPQDQPQPTQPTQQKPVKAAAPGGS